VFSGLRSWSNSDDGYDFWHATHPVLIEHCWSFDNGFFRPEWEDEVSGSWRGDGLGFKLGQDAAELLLNHVVAFGNKAFGIDENGNGSPDGVDINNTTLVNNAKDGNPLQISLNDGRPHTVRNSIAFDVDGDDVTDFSPEVDDAYNTWNGIGVSAADFVNIDMDQLLADAMAPRDPDGSLPDIGLHLAPFSDLIDAGDPNFVPEPADRDMDGQWRVWDGDEDGDWRVDMGADEFGSHRPGDLDGDDDIDVGDLAGLLANYGTTSGMTPADGDFDLDGDVDLPDLSALLAVYGTTCE
jgi:hypothetical protein